MVPRKSVSWKPIEETAVIAVAHHHHHTHCRGTKRDHRVMKDTSLNSGYSITHKAQRRCIVQDKSTSTSCYISYESASDSALPTPRTRTATITPLPPKVLFLPN